MNRRVLPGLVIGISLALLGLIAIQIYWIKNSITLRDAQFRYNVRAALASFRDELEHLEGERRLRQANLDKDFLMSLDSLSRGEGATLPLSDSPVRVQGDTVLDLGASGRFQLEVIRTDTVRTPAANPPQVWDQAGKALGGSPTEQAQVFRQLLSSMLSIDLENNFTRYYPSSMLDSLLSEKLNEVAGIDLPYHFAVFNRADQTEIIRTSDIPFEKTIRASDYVIRLFPNDFLAEPHYLKIYFPEQRTYLVRTLEPLLATSAALMLIIILTFAYSIRTIIRQRKLSDLKNDFINNMTHELKTPISTISLACEALADPDMRNSPAAVGNYLNMIRDENKRLGILVENVLRSAILDRAEVPMKLEPVNIHRVIADTVRNIEIHATRRGGAITTRLEAQYHVIEGDRIHLTNMVYNLLDNAIKYARQNPRIEVSSQNRGKFIRLEFKDNGVGIPKEHLGKIFERLYRVPTGNVHDTKGFGLGLSYVQVIVQKHGGLVTVNSELDVGSTFIVEIPVYYERITTATS